MINGSSNNNNVDNNNDNNNGQVNIIARANSFRFIVQDVISLRNIINGSINDTNRFYLSCVKILPNHTCVNRPIKSKYMTRLPEFAWKIYDSKSKLKRIYLLLQKKGMDHLIDNFSSENDTSDVETINNENNNNNVVAVVDDDESKIDTELSLDQLVGNTASERSTENLIWRLSSNLPLSSEIKIQLLNAPSCILRLNIIESFFSERLRTVRTL